MDERLSFVFITGLSGAGKSYAIKCFEDMGFFCVDNLPTTLIPTFADLTARSGQTIRRVALGVDVREGEYLSHLLDAIHELKTRGHPVEVLFLRSEEHTSELQSLAYLVCRLLLEKKKERDAQRWYN